MFWVFDRFVIFLCTIVKTQYDDINVKLVFGFRNNVLLCTCD